jgi:hypothetical protein
LLRTRYYTLRRPWAILARGRARGGCPSLLAGLTLIIAAFTKGIAWATNTLITQLEFPRRTFLWFGLALARARALQRYSLDGLQHHKSICSSPDWRSFLPHKVYMNQLLQAKRCWPGTECMTMCLLSCRFLPRMGSSDHHP